MLTNVKIDIRYSQQKKKVKVMDVYIYLAIIGIIAGLVKGISGFGSSLVIIPLVRLFTDIPMEDLVVMLITLNVSLNLLLFLESKAYKANRLKSVWVLTLFGAIFSIVGLELLHSLEDNVIQYLSMCLIVLAIIVKTISLFKIRIAVKESCYLQAIIGTMSGLGNGIASIDGPPVVFYLAGINADKTKFRSVLATHFLIMGLIAVIYSVIDSTYTREILLDTGFLIIFTIMGLILGILLSRKLDEKKFGLIVVVILIGLLISMIVA